MQMDRYMGMIEGVGGGMGVVHIGALTLQYIS